MAPELGIAMDAVKKIILKIRAASLRDANQEEMSATRLADLQWAANLEESM